MKGNSLQKKKEFFLNLKITVKFPSALQSIKLSPFLPFLICKSISVFSTAALLCKHFHRGTKSHSPEQKALETVPWSWDIVKHFAICGWLYSHGDYLCSVPVFQLELPTETETLVAIWFASWENRGFHTTLNFVSINLLNTKKYINIIFLHVGFKMSKSQS